MPDVPSPKSLADRLKKWEQLRDTVPQVLAEAPHMQTDHTDFDQALKALVLLEHDQEAATARLREATRRRDEQAVRVRLLNNRLVAGLQAHFGPEHERLIAFGVPPRRRRPNRRKAQAVPPPAPELVKADEPAG